ncbi:hypothetical protein K469DRAFT_698399 [Zopfia rhizophila CBS 207.26]|uniref:Uncharacterized protein n=1 Tax=Zopfia rhizophila CBS 207.26 TaxID=1314779 RepID=A0A6A6DAH0_9PEZI|nr:hypothetical protein K469DRAFT_698399 [Zopfia rhizophila CBS 207.26]
MILLSSLPGELLNAVVEQLEDDKQALANLCRTSNLYKSITQPVLYGSIAPTSRGLALFIRTLYDNFELASYVKKLTLQFAVRNTDHKDAIIGLSSWRHGEMLKFQRVCIEHITAVGNDLPEDSEQLKIIVKWKIGLRKRYLAASCGLLLMLLDRVEDLTVQLFDIPNRRKALFPLENLFGFGQAWADYDVPPEPPIPELSHTNNVTRLSTFGANLQVLLLGFNSLKILEIDLVDLGHLSYTVNQVGLGAITKL